jgi:hypothetical protein
MGTEDRIAVVTGDITRLDAEVDGPRGEDFVRGRVRGGHRACTRE